MGGIKNILKSTVSDPCRTIIIFLLFQVLSKVPVLPVLRADDRAEKLLKIKAEPGSSILGILYKYNLPGTQNEIERFTKLNKGKFTQNGGLLTGINYKLAINIYVLTDVTDGIAKSAEKSLGLTDTVLIHKIVLYNKELFAKGILRQPFRRSKLLLVPQYLLDSQEKPSEQTEENSIRKPEADKKKKSNLRPDTTGKSAVATDKKETAGIRGSKYSQDFGLLFGKKHRKIKVRNSKLKGHIYYLDPGHGGPDPGATGTKDGNPLHEDEYAYDIALRLAKKLLEHRAKVYVIVIDDKDGIRNEEYLKPGNEEYYLGGDTISHIQKVRLKKRASIINNLFKIHKKNSKSQQSVTIHLDSRETRERTDIFFYYSDDSETGKKLAETLCETIGEKYEQYQPGRGYKGTVSARNLLMLREVIPAAVYIELGNIQNRSDQVRFIQPDNRQAVANWICDGLLKYAAEKK